MPIVDVEIMLPPGEPLRSGLAAEIADRCAGVFGSPAGGTWVKLHTMPREHYAENGGGPPHEICPVFVSVLKARLPAPNALRAEVARLATAIAAATGRPAENIHIIYLPEGAGRVAFGGELAPAD